MSEQKLEVSNSQSQAESFSGQDDPLPGSQSDYPTEETAPPCPSRSPTPSTLHPWDQGDAVKELQELLCAHGFPLRIDGDFGSRTEAAVWAFQRHHKLRVDGTVDARTWFVLKSTLKPGTRVPHQGHSGIDVWELQGLLQVCGFPVRRDGIFGEETHRAVVAFQQRHHLHDDGRVSATTWTVLRAGRPLEQQEPQSGWLTNFRRWW